MRSQGIFWRIHNATVYTGFGSAYWFSKHVPGISMDITYLTIYPNFGPGIPAMNCHQWPVLPVIICVFEQLIEVETIALLHLNLYDHAMKAMDLENQTSSTNHLFEFQLSHQIRRLGFCRDSSACYPTPDHRIIPFQSPVPLWTCFHIGWGPETLKDIIYVLQKIWSGGFLPSKAQNNLV